MTTLKTKNKVSIDPSRGLEDFVYFRINEIATFFNSEEYKVYYNYFYLSPEGDELQVPLKEHSKRRTADHSRVNDIYNNIDTEGKTKSQIDVLFAFEAALTILNAERSENWNLNRNDWEIA
jgi:hypothetical protein